MLLGTLAFGFLDPVTAWTCEVVMSQIRKDAALINELVESIEEESISRILTDDGSVIFTLHTEEHGSIPITMIVEDPSAYTHSSALLMSEKAVPCLQHISEKLSSSCKLSKALRMLGNKLGLDLEWVRMQTANNLQPPFFLPQVL